MKFLAMCHLLCFSFSGTALSSSLVKIRSTEQRRNEHRSANVTRRTNRPIRGAKPTNNEVINYGTMLLCSIKDTSLLI